MAAQWNSEFAGKLRSSNIKQIELAAHLGYSPEYVSAVLNGKRNPKNAESKFKEALEQLLAGKQELNSI